MLYILRGRIGARPGGARERRDMVGKPGTRSPKRHTDATSPRAGGSPPQRAKTARTAREPKEAGAASARAAGGRPVTTGAQLDEVMDLLRDIRASVDRLAGERGPQREREPMEGTEGTAGRTGEWGDLDQVMITIRRVIGEALDRSMERVLAPLVGVRLALSRPLEAGGVPSGPDGDLLRGSLAASAEELDRVLHLLGAEPYWPVPGEFFDPLIHREAGETRRDGLEPGAIVGVLQPGFKTGRGRVIAPAAVTVNRG